MKENREVTDINVGDIEEILKKFSTSKRIKMYELLRIFKREGIENFVTTRKKYVDVILSDYKRVLKENEELLEVKVSASAHNRILKLEKENEELNLKYHMLYTEKIDKQKAQEVKIKSQVIPIQKVKDKIEKIK